MSGADTIPDLLARRVARTPQATAFYGLGEAGRWESIAWAALAARAASVTAALRAHDLKPGDRVAIVAPTSLEWEVAQLGSLGACGSVAGVDPYYPDELLGAVLESVAPTVVFGKDAALFARIPASIRATARLLVALQGEGSTGIVPLARFVSETAPCRGNGPDPADLAIITFSSGTTGRPKPIPYTHSQVVIAVRAILDELPEIGEGAQLLCWLPLANLFQRIINFCAIERGATSYVVQDPREVVQHLATANPHVFIGVPRFFERLHAGILERLARSPAVVRRFVLWGLETGTRRAERLRAGLGVGFGDRVRWRIADALVIRRFRAVFGHNIQFLISGSAPMPVWLLEWFEGLGLPVLEAYGVSENIVPVAMNRPTARRLGTVGRPISGNEVALGPDSEIRVRGPGVFRGYLGTDSPAPAADGFWATGDLGEFTPDGFLRLSGRKCDAFKTAGGRWVIPAEVEARLLRIAYVEYAVVLGTERNLSLAILNVALARLRAVSGRPAPTAAEVSEGLTEEEGGRIAREVRGAVAELPSYLRPAGILIVTAPFSIAAGELTTNLKLRRQFVSSKFRDQLAELQDGAARALSRAGPADAPLLPVVVTA